jgi:hypothetical protein
VRVNFRFLSILFIILSICLFIFFWRPVGVLRLY